MSVSARVPCRVLPPGVPAIGACLLAAVVSTPVGAQECAEAGSHPEWIFCDDFESTGPLVAEGRYFEHDDDEGEFVVMGGVGLGGSHGMRARWQAGEVNAGNLKLAFGRNPSAYMDRGIRSEEDFREVWYRMYLRMEDGWTGNPNKLSRATVFHAADWSQAMIAHLWEGPGDLLGLDPVSCVDAAGQVICEGYNDFDHMTWLGQQPGVTPIFAPAFDDTWFCIEAHVRLDDPGASDGISEFWIDDALEARGDGLRFVGPYADYAINAIFFENYTNAGSPQTQERYFDDIVVSTEPIGCAPSGPLFTDGFESGDTSAWSSTTP